MAPTRSFPSTPVRRLLFPLIAVGLGLAVAVALFEIGSWRVPGGRTGSARVEGGLQGPAPEAAFGWVSDRSVWYGTFGGRNVSLRFDPVPFARVPCDNQIDPDGGPVCSDAQLNSSGFRMPEFTRSHPPDVFRIVVVGDSFTWGDGVNLGQTYHRRLQARFDGRGPVSGLDVEVIALGVNGSRFHDNVARLVTQAEALKPDLALVQFYNNDLQDTVALDMYSSGSDERYVDFLLDATALGRLLRGRVDDWRQGRLWMAELNRMYDPASPEWNLMQSGLDTLTAWSEASGTPVAFLSFPEVDTSRGKQNYGQFRNPPDAYELRERVEREFERRGFPLLRVIDVFRARAGDRFLAVSPTDGHYGPLANELVADAVYEFLRDADWVDLAFPLHSGDARWGTEAPLRQTAADRWSDYHRSAALQLELFGQLLELLPDDPWLIRDSARLQLARGDRGRCRDLFEHLAAIAPDFSAPWFYLADCVETGETREGLLIRMLETVPDHAGTLEELARLDIQAGRLDRGCGCYQRLVHYATDPEQAIGAIGAIRANDCAAVTGPSCPGLDPTATSGSTR